MWWRQHSLEGKSGCLGIPASLSLDVSEVGGSDAPPAAQTCLQIPAASGQVVWSTWAHTWTRMILDHERLLYVMSSDHCGHLRSPSLSKDSQQFHNTCLNPARCWTVALLSTAVLSSVYSLRHFQEETRDSYLDGCKWKRLFSSNSGEGFFRNSFGVTLLDQRTPDRGRGGSRTGRKRPLCRSVSRNGQMREEEDGADQSGPL